jgi:hypothetical protein
LNYKARARPASLAHGSAPGRDLWVRREADLYGGRLDLSLQGREDGGGTTRQTRSGAVAAGGESGFSRSIWTGSSC